MAGLHDPATFSDLVAHRAAPLAATGWRSARTTPTWTYRQLEDRIARADGGAAWRRACGAGEGVGVLSPNRPEVYLAQTAPSFAGGRYTALHPMGSLDDHVYACDEAELRGAARRSPSTRRGPASCSSAVRRVERVLHVRARRRRRGARRRCSRRRRRRRLRTGGPRPRGVSWLLYTGGTTGVPKAAMLPERAVAQMVQSVSIGWDLPAERRYLACAPISHAAGMLVTPVLLAGGHRRPDAGVRPGEWLRQAADHRATRRPAGARR